MKCRKSNWIETLKNNREKYYLSFKMFTSEGKKFPLSLVFCLQIDK